MTIWILNFGEGPLAVNYLIFTTVASLGALQFIAGRGRLVGLMLLPARESRWLGLALVAGAYAWFFTFQPDLLIPGLAGGEFFTLFIAGFLLALMISISLGIVNNRIFTRAAIHLPRLRESVALGPDAFGELWLPEPTSKPPLVIALREAKADSLDVLSADLVTAGAAVLLCDVNAAEGAVWFMDEHADLFHPTRRFAMGVGRGADRVLKLAGENNKFLSVLALAPFGDQKNARPGLHWLRETDYVAALAVTFSPVETAYSQSSTPACIIYGDEDSLIPPATVRSNRPAALMVAGARHFTLARMSATKRLAADFFELGSPAVGTSERLTVPASRIREGLGE
jgi:hypothetical protein